MEQQLSVVHPHFGARSCKLKQKWIATSYLRYQQVLEMVANVTIPGQVYQNASYLAPSSFQNRIYGRLGRIKQIPQIDEAQKIAEYLPRQPL